ncbi:baseplate structural protein [Leuconostoc phage 1-A4]|uniref:Baseplate structural protein n=1 Tax=Leuconostoc phage 1-A4 TaxID=745088 RepID=D4N4L7_9CAUD|nr:baseplate structural protein [Leuconostoc phage 1-A4]ADD71767.1 baseplate structural protein [Leuconostoc phage 1-A4]
MKVCRVYTNSTMFYTVVSENNSYEFWYMITNNGWIAEEITNERL